MRRGGVGGGLKSRTKPLPKNHDFRARKGLNIGGGFLGNGA